MTNPQQPPEVVAQANSVELLVADASGVPRGKVVSGTTLTGKPAVQMPVAIFFQTIVGSYADAMDVHDPADEDLLLYPDWSTAAPVPWKGSDFAQVICRSAGKDGEPSPYDSRNVLSRVLDAYAADGLTPVVAPEVEFYLLTPGGDPAEPLKPAAGIHGRQENGSEAFAIDSLIAFEGLLGDVRSACREMSIELHAVVHEMGPSQIELNMGHGDALQKADHLFLTKRTVKAYAQQAGYVATFMAKPLERRPGSGLHLHQSVLDSAGRNVLGVTDGQANTMLSAYIAGLQRYFPLAMALVAPNVNSYRRFVPGLSAPINAEWGFDNRTVGFRVPFSGPGDVRVENRVPGADANPYLIIAASLACGLLGMRGRLAASEPFAGDAYGEDGDFPLELEIAIDALARCKELTALLGKPFIDAYCSVKRAELAAYRAQVSPWEREYLARDI